MLSLASLTHCNRMYRLNLTDNYIVKPINLLALHSSYSVPQATEEEACTGA